MGIRVTVVLDENNIEKLRGIQGKMIKSSTKSVSFSKVLNRVLDDGLKKFKPWKFLVLRKYIASLYSMNNSIDIIS